MKRNKAVLRTERRVNFAHATHEDPFVINCTIRITCPQQRAKMAPFRLVPGGFRRVSIEILYDRALGGPRKPVSGFGFPDCLLPVMRLNREIAPCYLAQPPREQFITSD